LVILAFGTGAFGQIAVEPSKCDFGSFKDRVHLQMQTVVLRNKGTKGVIIENVYTSCSCLQAAFSGPQLLAPGKTVSCIVVLDPSKATWGDHSQSIVVELDQEHEGGGLQVPVTYSYKPDVELSKQELVVRAETDRPTTATGVGSASLRIFDHWGQRLVIESVSCSNPLIETSILDVNYVYRGYAQHSITVYAFLGPEWPVGPFAETLEIQTNHPEFKTIRIPIHGEVVGEVSAHPAKVMLSDLHPGQYFEREIVLTSKMLMVLGDIQSTSRTMKWNIESTNADNEIRIKLNDTVDVSDSAIVRGDIYASEITIEVKAPSHYWLTIPVAGPIILTQTK
jgi:hypothetical protein